MVDIYPLDVPFFLLDVDAILQALGLKLNRNMILQQKILALDGPYLYGQNAQYGMRDCEVIDNHNAAWNYKGYDPVTFSCISYTKFDISNFLKHYNGIIVKDGETYIPKCNGDNEIIWVNEKKSGDTYTPVEGDTVSSTLLRNSSKMGSTS